jgi:hypothetical protein
VTRSSKTLEQQHAVHTEKTTQTRRAWNKFLPDFAFCLLRNSKKKFTKALGTRLVMLVRKLQTQLKEDEEKAGIRNRSGNRGERGDREGERREEEEEEAREEENTARQERSGKTRHNAPGPPRQCCPDNLEISH